MNTDDRFLQATLPAADIVHNLARRLTRSRADAEDLVQETYTRAWAAWSAGRRPDRVTPWLATICLNLVRDGHRRAVNRAETTTWEESYDRPGQIDVAAEALGRVTRSHVETALRRLPEEQRIAITLMDLCGFTAAETAKITSAPRGTVLARVHRGRKKLAQALRQEVAHDAP